MLSCLEYSTVCLLGCIFVLPGNALLSLFLLKLGYCAACSLQHCEDTDQSLFAVTNYLEAMTDIVLSFFCSFITGYVCVGYVCVAITYYRHYTPISRLYAKCSKNRLCFHW